MTATNTSSSSKKRNHVTVNHCRKKSVIFLFFTHNQGLNLKKKQMFSLFITIKHSLMTHEPFCKSNKKKYYYRKTRTVAVGTNGAQGFPATSLALGSVRAIVAME